MNSSHDNYQDLRDQLTPPDKFTGEFTPKTPDHVDTGKIFGLAAGERMMISVIMFLTVTVLATAVLLATNTIMLPG